MASRLLKKMESIFRPSTSAFEMGIVVSQANGNLKEAKLSGLDAGAFRAGAGAGACPGIRQSRAGKSRESMGNPDVKARVGPAPSFCRKGRRTGSS